MVKRWVKAFTSGIVVEHGRAKRIGPDVARLECGHEQEFPGGVAGFKPPGSLRCDTCEPQRKRPAAHPVVKACHLCGSDQIDVRLGGGHHPPQRAVLGTKVPVWARTYTVNCLSCKVESFWPLAGTPEMRRRDEWWQTFKPSREYGPDGRTRPIAK